MGLSWYNGHCPQKRERVQAWLNKQWDAGTLPRPSRCAVCGQTGGTIHGHLENYDEPESYIDLCITCHLILHCRYRNHKAWLEYRRRVAAGWQAPALTQREAFGVLLKGVLAGHYPVGTHRDPPGPTFLDTLGLDRNPAPRLF